MGKGVDAFISGISIPIEVEHSIHTYRGIYGYQGSISRYSIANKALCEKLDNIMRVIQAMASEMEYCSYYCDNAWTGEFCYPGWIIETAVHSQDQLIESLYSILNMRSIRRLLWLVLCG